MQGTFRRALERSTGARSRSRAVVRLLSTVVFFGAATASAPFLTPAFAQSFSFSNVVVEGNTSVDPATILSYAGISRGQEVSAAALNDAYQRIANSGLFETVELVPPSVSSVLKATSG